jgi:acetolactate synthase-1/2/3 large subunit
MDNAAYGTIAGLTQMHFGWEFGCVFESGGERYRTDFAQIARGYGAEGVFIRNADELGPALAKALAAGKPAVIQAPMENIPTPTPGHWDINVVYRKGS